MAKLILKITLTLILLKEEDKIISTYNTQVDH